MSEEQAVEQVTQEVKDVKLENGTAPGAANGTPNKNDNNAIPFKVIFLMILSTLQLFKIFMVNRQWKLRSSISQ